MLPNMLTVSLVIVVESIRELATIEDTILPNGTRTKVTVLFIIEFIIPFTILNSYAKRVSSMKTVEDPILVNVPSVAALTLK